MAGKSTGQGGPVGDRIAAHILIIEARFYGELADQMADGAIAEIEAHGGTWERIAVPGALEIPQVVRVAGDSERYDGVVAIGCVVRGETYHFEIVCNNANHWLMEAAHVAGIPVGNAILTVDTLEQAADRAQGGRDGKGGDAARACLRLIEIERQLATTTRSGARA